MKQREYMDIDIALKEPIYFLLMRSPEVRKEIENIYLQKEEHYKNILRELSPDTHFFNGVQTGDKWNILLMKTITKEMEESDPETYSTFIMDLIKKSYKRIYDYAQRNTNYNPEMFSNYIYNREPNVTDDRMGLYQFLYLYIAKDTPNFAMPRTPFMGIILENLALMVRDVTKDRPVIALTEEEKKQSMECFTSLTGMKWRNNEPKIIVDIFAEIEVHAVKAYPKINREIQRTGNTRLAYKIKPLSYLRHALSFLQIFEYDNTYFLYEIAITKEDWNSLYKSYLLGCEGKGFTEDDRDELLMFSLVQYTQHIAYKMLEDKFWNMKMAENMEEIRREQNAIEENRALFRKEKEAFEREKIKNDELVQLQLNQKDKELEQMRKELSLIQQENEKLLESVELLPVLQEAIFQDNLDEVQIEETYDLELLKDKNIVLVGGHDSFRNRMKEHFKDLYVIAPEEKSVGITQVKNADIILFETGYNNHNQFDRLKSVITKDQLLIFLNSITSIERVEREIYLQLSKFENNK